MILTQNLRKNHEKLIIVVLLLSFTSCIQGAFQVNLTYVSRSLDVNEILNLHDYHQKPTRSSQKITSKSREIKLDKGQLEGYL